MHYASNHALALYEYLLQHQPTAIALVKGAPGYSQISGTIAFYQLRDSVFMTVEIAGLPQQASTCEEEIYGFHIHGGPGCSGSVDDPFSNTGTHYNPQGCEHPQHAGDLPPLFNCNGSVWMSFITDRFAVSEIIGRTIVLHSSADDFTTQPAGNAGEKIACGEIVRGY